MHLEFLLMYIVFSRWQPLVGYLTHRNSVKMLIGRSIGIGIGKWVGIAIGIGIGKSNGGAYKWILILMPIANSLSFGYPLQT